MLTWTGRTEDWPRASGIEGEADEWQGAEDDAPQQQPGLVSQGRGPFPGGPQPEQQDTAGEGCQHVEVQQRPDPVVPGWPQGNADRVDRAEGEGQAGMKQERSGGVAPGQGWQAGDRSHEEDEGRPESGQGPELDDEGPRVARPVGGRGHRQGQAGQAGEEDEHPGVPGVGAAQDHRRPQQGEDGPQGPDGVLHGALAQRSRRHVEVQLLTAGLLQHGLRGGGRGQCAGADVRQAAAVGGEDGHSRPGPLVPGLAPRHDPGDARVAFTGPDADAQVAGTQGEGVGRYGDGGKGQQKDESRGLREVGLHEADGAMGPPGPLPG